MRKLTFTLLLLTLSTWAYAQDWYIQLTASHTHSVSENMKGTDILFDLPGATFSVGNNFSRKLGARLSFGFNPQSGHASRQHEKAFPDDFKKYTFFTGAGYADFMINLKELFSEPNPWSTDGIFLFIGGGAIYTFNFSNNVKGPLWEKYYPVNTAEKIYPVARIGLAGSFKIAESLDLAVEGKYNFIDDKYNGVTHGGPIDGYMEFSVGINYFFNRHHSRFTEYPYLPREIMDFPKHESYRPGKFTNVGISFYFNNSHLQPKQDIYMETIAKLLYKHNRARLIIHGYPDNDTTDPQELKDNQLLALSRAMEVKNALVSRYGISADRLSTSTHNGPKGGYHQNGEWIRSVEFEME